jgi:uncharacterized membrane protein
MSKLEKPVVAVAKIKFAELQIPKWIFFSILANIFYGLMGLFAKFASNTISPLLVAVISTFGMAPILVVLLFSKNLRNVHGKIGSGVFFSVLVGLLSSIGAIFLYFSFSKGGLASVVVPIGSLASLVTVILARFVFKDRLNKYQLIGVVLSIIAILMFNITFGGSGTESTSVLFFKSLTSSWMLFALMGLFSAGTAGIFIKAGTNHISADLHTVIVLAVNLALSVVLIFTQGFLWEMSSTDFWACLFVGILGSAGFLAQAAAYSSGMASLVAPMCSLFPVVTVIFAAPILGEKLTLIIIGAVIISSIAAIALSIEKTPEAEIQEQL